MSRWRPFMGDESGESGYMNIPDPPPPLDETTLEEAIVEAYRLLSHREPLHGRDTGDETDYDPNEDHRDHEDYDGRDEYQEEE